MAILKPAYVITKALLCSVFLPFRIFRAAVSTAMFWAQVVVDLVFNNFLLLFIWETLFSPVVETRSAASDPGERDVPPPIYKPRGRSFSDSETLNRLLKKCRLKKTKKLKWKSDSELTSIVRRSMNLCEIASDNEKICARYVGRINQYQKWINKALQSFNSCDERDSLTCPCCGDFFEISFSEMEFLCKGWKNAQKTQLQRLTRSVEYKDLLESPHGKGKNSLLIFTDDRLDLMTVYEHPKAEEVGEISVIDEFYDYIEDTGVCAFCDLEGF